MLLGIQQGREKGLEEGREEGREKGREEGEEAARKEIARSLLDRLSTEEISQITGLSADEIAQLR